MGSCLNPWCGLLSAGTRTMYSEPNLVDGHLWNPGDMSRLSRSYPVGEVEGRGVVPDSDISTSLCTLLGSISFLILKYFSSLQHSNWNGWRIYIYEYIRVFIRSNIYNSIFLYMLTPVKYSVLEWIVFKAII